MSDEPDDDWFDDDEPDDDDDLSDECGMTPDGYCQLAGSEWCDWSCPISREHNAARIKAMKEKQS